MGVGCWLLAFGFWLELKTELSMDRISMLTEILTANPADSLAHYGLAMEYSQAGQVEEAVREFKALIAENPDYTPAYFMGAQTLANASRIDEAKRMLADGI